ncbi:MAG: hypothetical protein FWC87_10335 [Acidimicrobiaceae bacterium]|nr:hypothetical protein [Acidimicrobiaceae bacterium]
MSVSGANLEQLYQLGKQFCSDADSIQTLIKNIDNQIAAAQWTGTNATQWTNQWQSQFKPALNNVGEGQGGLRPTGVYLMGQAQGIGQATGTQVG